MRPTYFLVYKVDGREVPALYWDEVWKQPRNTIYIVRLDTLPGGREMAREPIWKLYETFCQLRKRNELPPQWQPPPKQKSGETTIQLGNREHHPRYHLSDTAYDPHA